MTAADLTAEILADRKKIDGIRAEVHQLNAQADLLAREGDDEGSLSARQKASLKRTLIAPKIAAVNAKIPKLEQLIQAEYQEANAEANAAHSKHVDRLKEAFPKAAAKAEAEIRTVLNSHPWLRERFLVTVLPQSIDEQLPILTQNAAAAGRSSLATPADLTAKLDAARALAMSQEVIHG